MKTISALFVVLGLGSAAHAEYVCTTNSYGHTFTASGDNEEDARIAVVTKCQRDYDTANLDCAVNAQCTQRVAKPAPIPQPVVTQSCYVKQLNRMIPQNQFFSMAHDYSAQHHQCVVARLYDTAYSARVYDTRGERVGNDHLGLSNSDVEYILHSYGLHDCARMTCQLSLLF